MNRNFYLFYAKKQTHIELKSNKNQKRRRGVNFSQCAGPKSFTNFSVVQVQRTQTPQIFYT